MATFVHLFPAEARAKICDGGIKLSKIHYNEVQKGIFCMPVIQDFYATHQWVREMTRFRRNLLAVYFRIPDSQEVWCGHFNHPHTKMSAAHAVNAFSKMDDKMGYQVILPVAVDSSAIIKIKKLPPMGWRYYPAAKGQKLTCFCPACIVKGEYGKNVLLEKRLAEMENAFFAAQTPEEQAVAIGNISTLIVDQKLKLKSWKDIVDKADLSNKSVLTSIGWLLLNLRNKEAQKLILNMLPNLSSDLQIDFATSIIFSEGEDGIRLLGNIADIPEVSEFIREYREHSEDGIFF